jgi:hypothetical protein
MIAACTAYDTPDAVLKEPGCDCDPEDEFSFESCPVHTPKDYRRVEPEPHGPGLD